MTAAVPRSKLKVNDKVKFLKETEVNIFSFNNKKQMGISTLTFLPMAEFSSSFAESKQLLTLGETA